MKPSSKPSPVLGSFSFRPKFILSAIILLAFALRAARLDFQPLWWDEGYSLFFATRDFTTILDRTALDIHPPLYYALLQLWMLFAGKSDIVVRFVSVAIGTAAIPFLYVLAQRTLSQPIALIAAFLLAIAPIHVYYSQEVRMYELVTLLCIASVYFYVRLLHAPSRTLWVAYILSSSAALYTQYYAAFILVFEFLFILTLFIRRSPLVTRRLTYQSLFAWIAIAALYLPWVIYAGNKLYNYVAFKVSHEAYPTQDSFSFIAQHLTAFSIGHPSATPLLSWVAIPFILLSGFGIYSLFRHRVAAVPTQLPIPSASALLISLYLLIPLGLGYLVNVRFPFHPIRYERLLLLASPAFYLLVASGIAAINRRVVALLATCLLVAFSTQSLYDFYNVQRYPDDDYRSLVTEIQTLAQPGDNFLAIYPWQIGYLESYYHGAPLNVIETPNDTWINNPSQMRSDLDALLAKQPRVWIPALQTLGRIVEDSLDASLRTQNYSILDAWFGTTRLELFGSAADPRRATGSLSLGNGVTLSNWGASGDAVVSGQDIVRLWFDWGANLPAKLKLSLRLVDAKSNTWMQDDRDIESGIQRVGLSIPAGTPPGVYDLRLALYRENETSATSVSLATVNIELNQNENFAAIPQHTTTQFVNGLQVVGFDAMMKPLKPGEPAGITLFWKAAQTPNADYLVSIQLQDVFGKTYLDAKDAIAFGVYTPLHWRSNELVRDPHTFTVGGNVPDGTYHLNVGLVDPASQARVKMANGQDSAQLMTVQVIGRKHYFGVPTPSHPADARFGVVGRLVGYDVNRSGQNLRVVLYWKALGGSQISYKGFVHVLDASGKLVAQRDQIPGAGGFPTTNWVNGEYLVDIYDLTLPNDLSGIQIQIGLYDPASEVRLPIVDTSGNQVGDNLILK